MDNSARRHWVQAVVAPGGGGDEVKTPSSAARSIASEAPGVAPEEVVATRAGEVLLPHTLLKVRRVQHAVTV